jgi:hypothetical protein
MRPDAVEREVSSVCVWTVESSSSEAREGGGDAAPRGAVLAIAIMAGG